MKFIAKMVRSLRYRIWTLPQILVRQFLFRFQHIAYEAAFSDKLDEWQPDIVLCNDWQTLHLGAEYKERNGGKLVFDSHELETHRNPPLPPRRRRWMQRYEKTYLPQCDLVTTVNEPIAAYLAQEYDLPKPPVIVNSPVQDKGYLPPVIEEWGRIPAAGESVRSAFSGDDFVVVIVGNATVNRGIELAFEALKELPDKIKLAIVGKATDAFSDMMQRRIAKLKLEGRVKLVEPVNPGSLVEFLKSADLGLIPIIPETLSYELALPNKLFECAFADLPVLASDIFVVEKMIKDYDLGQTFSAGDVDALTKGVLKFYEQRQTLKVNNSGFRNKFAYEQGAKQAFSLL